MTDNNLKTENTFVGEGESTEIRRMKRNFNIVGVLVIIFLCVVFCYCETLSDRLNCGAAIISITMIVACIGGSLDRFRVKEKSDLEKN
jgi:hypothetical protein